MFTWLEAAVMCEELYGVETNMKEGYFVFHLLRCDLRELVFYYCLEFFEYHIV